MFTYTYKKRDLTTFHSFNGTLFLRACCRCFRPFIYKHRQYQCIPMNFIYIILKKTTTIKKVTLLYIYVCIKLDTL